MRTSCLSIPPCAIGFLLSLHLVISRPLEGTDNVPDVKNLPEDRNVAQRSRGVNTAVTTIGDQNSPANSGPPGCCTPELYLGFDNATADRRELEGRRAQFPEVSSEKGPCINYADLNTGHLQFKSANLATVTDAITIAVWVKLRSRLGIQPILVLEGEAGALRFELFEGFITWRYSTTRPSLATFALLSDTPVVPENIWTHLLVQYDAHTRRCAVFLNGEKILNGFSREGPLEIAWGELTSIGKFSIDEELVLKLDGSIDEFYIYYCSLPEIVIRGLVQECHVDGKCSPLGPVGNEPCDISTFQCKNGKCAKKEWRCDGENDCGDWSDEMGCDGFCGPGEQSSASQGQCLSCYCSERSKNCSHANLYRDRVAFTPKLRTSPRDPPMYLVDITGGEVSDVKYTADHRNKELVAYNVSKGSQLYWALPREFLGNKLTSYGGKLRYSVKYSVDDKSKEDNPGSLSRHARIVRDVASFVDLEQEYFINGNGDEDANGGSGLTTLDTMGTTQVTKISTTGKVTSDGEQDTTTAELHSSYSTQSAVFQPLTAITELVSTETDALTQAQHGTSTSLSSTDYTTDRSTKELFQSTEIPDTVSMVTESSTTGEVETDASNAIVSSSVYSAGSPTARVSTTISETPPITTVASTESQEETTTAYSFSSTAVDASTDEQDEITTAVTSTSMQDSYTYSQYETTSFVPHQPKRTEKSTTVAYTAMSDGSSIATEASAEDQDETTTALPSSTYSIDKTTTEASTTIPELVSSDTGTNGETTAATFSSAYTTDTANTETPTTISLISSWEKHPSTANQVDTAIAVSYSSFSTVMPITEEPTTTQDTSSTVTDAPAASVSTYETLRAKEDTTEVTTTSRAVSEISIAGTSTLAVGGEERTTVVSTSTYSTVTTPTEEITTMPETSTTATDVWTEEDGEANTQPAPSTVYNTLILDEKTQTTIQRTTSSAEGVLTDSQKQTSTSYSTDRPSSTSFASILDTSSTINIAFTEEQDEITTVVPDTVQSTETPASEALAVIPETSSTVAEAQYETTATLPSSFSGIDSTAAVTTISRTTTFSAEDTSSEGEHKTSTAESSTHRGTDSYTFEASAIIPDTSSTAAVALTEEETTTFAPSSTFSTDDAGMEETTTIPFQSTVVDVASTADDTTTTTPPSVYSPGRQTTEEAITEILDTSSVATDVSDDRQNESTTVVSSSVDVGPTAGETSTFVIPSSYSTEKVSSDETTEENTTTFAPSSTYSTDEAGMEETATIPFQASTLADVASAPEDTTTAAGETSTFAFPSSYSTDEITAIPDTSSTLAFASTGVPGDTTTDITSLAHSTERQTTKVYTEIPDTTSKETRASTEFIDETSTAASLSGDSSVRATTGEPSTAITETSSTAVNLSTEEQEETTTSYSTKEPTPQTSSTPLTETSPTSEDETASFLSSSAPSSRKATPEAVTIPVTKTVTDSSTEGQDETTTIEPSLAYSSDRQTTEASTDTSYTATDFSTESGEATTVVSPLSYNTDTQTAEETTTPSHTSSMVTDTTTLVQDYATTTGSPGTPVDVTDVSALKIFTVPVSFPTYRPGIETTEESTVLQTSVLATDTSTKSRDEETTVVPSPSYSPDSPTKADTTVTSDKSSTITDVNIVGKKTTTVESLTSEAVTSPSAPTTPTSPSLIAEAVRLVGKDTTLIFHDLQPSSGSSQATVQVPLTEAKWRLADGARISRDTFLKVLSDVQDIFVRASYNGDGSGPKTLSIRDLSFDVASVQDSGFGKALLVEQCECPVGYSGLSCESCKPGYYQSRAGEVSAACIRCDCHGHSEDGCDPDTGQCKNCKHNTDGIRCEKCLSGFYGNATIGKPSDCKACPCPVTSPPGRVSPTCFMAEDGQPTCDGCPPGYGGRRCEKCVKPYEGDPTTPGGKCKLSESISESIVSTTKKRIPAIDCGCDVHGSVNSSCDPLTRQCYCKKHVEGRTCDKCKGSFFNLQSDEPDGCVACFCFGVSKDCKCADYYKDIIRLSFVLIEGPEFLRLSDLARQTIVGNGFQVQGDPQYFVYDKFDKLATGTYYWFLGDEFRGDMISSYDGIMRYTVSHEMNPGGELTSETDVQITGRGLVLKYRHGRRLEGGKKGLYGLKLSETWLRFPDGSRVTRDNVMTALSAVDSILIRATYSTTTTQASLYDVTLEKGVPQATRFGKAKNIEECSCPPEYIGTSCQHCAHGYTRSYPGPNFSPCVSCPCNQHSKECDPENGQCVRCDHNTTGPQCDKCSVGFYGDPTKGTPKDCLPCPCPLTVASNQFSRICKLESDGNPTCTACQIGYTGRNCERCATGYAGNPSNQGEKCIKIPADFLPTVRVRPMRRIREEGGNALFYCFAGGQPKPGFSWSRKDKQPMSRRVFIKGKRLLIRGVKKEDEGTYLCTARNVYGSEISSGQLTVKVRLEDPIVVSVSPKVLHVPLNQSAQFTCKAKSVTDYRLKWTRGMYGALPKGAANVNGVLSIQKTQIFHGGTYTCTGKNAFSDDMATVQLRVGGVTSPQVFISPTRLSVLEGESAQFRCSATGFPAPVLQWHGGPGGRLPPEAKITNGNGILTFVKVKEIQEGEYFCTASNEGGISIMSTFLNVSAAGSVPVISVSPSSLTISEGQEALFQCTADGDPAPVIRWSRENGPFPEFSTLENGMLRIFPTRPEDGGAYVCTAANSFGARAFLVNLRIERDTSVAPTALIAPAKQTVDEGSSTFLSCQVTGDPYPSIQWSKVGGTLTDNHAIEGGLMQIKEVTKDDEGMYVCVAQNKKGVEQATGILNVRRKVMPKIEIMPARKLTVTGGETVVFKCVVKAGNPPPAVVWKREENEPLNSSNDGILVITRVSGDSQGKYICKATNALGSTEAIALLIVQGEPKVIVSPSSPFTVIAGSSVTLECAAAGDPSPSVQWIAPEDSRSSLQLIEGDRGVLKLVIENARPKDQGNYTCQAENLVGITRASLELLVTVAHEAPEVVVEPGSQTVTQGDNVEFQCNASGIPTPSLIWERLGSNLPEGAADRNGVLILTSVSPENGGTYVCKAVNSEGADSINVQLKVIVPPRVDVTPSQISVREGNSFSLYCVVTPSLPVAWSKVNGTIPHGNENATGILSVSKAEVEHAGKYRCYASNVAGSSESFASVTVFAAPKVMAWPESLLATPNSNVSFQCNATGIPDPVITWTKEGGDLPKRHSIVHGVLNLVRLISFDDGRYICTATNAAGATGASVKLTVEDLPHVTIAGGTSVKTVPVGGNLTLECIGTGIPQPHIQWSRIDGPLSDGLVVEGGFLIIKNARHSYGGAYKCEVTNRVGSVQSRVAIFVQESPKVTVTPYKSRVKIGEPAEFTCLASGSPSPDLSWRKLNGLLPAGSTEQGGVLRIVNVTENESGTYVCDATNVEGSANGSAVLEIKVTVPRFTQKPLSYLSFPTLTHEPLNFTIEVVFIPETADGLILYNDQLNNGSVGDFISFGMSDGFAEFRFDLGFEPAIIRSQQPLRRHEWHTVILSRDAKEGNLTVDGKPPVTGISKGSNTGLNLNQNLYVGGVPDFSSIRSLAGFISGFIGCLSYLTINGKVANLGGPVNHLGLDDCEVCQTKPCKNGGTCTEVTRDWGFVCSCRQGYSGRTCHNSSQRCSPGVCNEGRCENIGDDGFRCICPAGYSGKRCERGTPIDTPMFEGDSFMSFPGIEGAVSQLKFSINFMVLKSEQNMLLFYNGQKPYPARGDFISLAINHGRVEFKFNLGSGPGVVYSTKNVSLGIWHTVVVERKRDEASMKLDNEPPVKAYSPCCSIGLNLQLDLFIGGLDNFTTVDTDRLGVSSGLFGCISSVSVDGREINLLKSNINQRDIKQCAECLLPCEIKPCLNNATCIPVGKTGFVCSCAQGYTGQKCEFALIEPGKNKTCLNRGVEFPSLNRICTCPIGYGGQRCETSIKIGDSASFSGDGYLEFPASAMRGPRVAKPDYMSLDIKPEAGNGVILWQGQKRDHFAIGLRDGFLEFRFELGSGPAVLLSRVPVNDGKWHSVEVFRSFDKAFLKVDNEAHVNGTSAAGSKGLNLDGDARIFIGGGNNVADLTRDKFDTGFTGCIKNVHFKSRKMSFQGDALRGWNVLPCDL